MSNIIADSVVEIINNPKSIKVLATVDQKGIPHVVFKQSITVNEEGFLKYCEIIESSKTNQNMTNSIWHNKWVSINVLFGEQSYQIKGKIYRAIIYGKEFEQDYVRIKEAFQEDLSTIWLIEPLEVIDETFSARSADERSQHPLFQHLDQV